MASKPRFRSRATSPGPYGIDISILSNGVVRPAIEKTDIKATISGIINDVYVYEGQKVKKGDILLRFRASSSHEKIAYQDNRLKDFEDHISDLKTLSLGGKPSVFRSPTRLQEYQLYVSKKQELQVAPLPLLVGPLESGDGSC